MLENTQNPKFLMSLSSRWSNRLRKRLLKRRDEKSLSAIWWRYLSAVLFLNLGLLSLPFLLAGIALYDYTAVAALAGGILLAMLLMAYHQAYLSVNRFHLDRRSGLGLFWLGADVFLIGAAMVWKWIGSLGGLSGGTLQMLKLNTLVVFAMGGLFYLIRIWEARRYPRKMSVSMLSRA